LAQERHAALDPLAQADPGLPAEQLAGLVHAEPPVAGQESDHLREVLLSASTAPGPGPGAEIAQARDRFLAAHLAEARLVVQRAVARSELPPGTDPGVLIELVIGPALLRTLLLGLDLGPEAAAGIAARAEAALRSSPA
jgi:hypothetical protein